MSIEIFDNRRGNGDDSYQDWLLRHTEGYVLNTRRALDPSYMVLHRARCRSITAPTRSTSPHPFTGSGYVKICATTVDELRDWVLAHGGEDFSKRCGLCSP